MLRRFSSAVASSREGQRFSHETPSTIRGAEDARLRTIYRAENIGNVLKRVVNVCQQEFVNEVYVHLLMPKAKARELLASLPLLRDGRPLAIATPSRAGPRRGA